MAGPVNLDMLRLEAEQALMFDQPALTVSVAGNQVVVAGDYFLNSEGSTPDPLGPIATFSVSVQFDPKFPYVEPAVRETAGKIPKGRHLNPNGTCCLGVWEQWLVEAEDKSVSAFFSRPFRDFFLSQTYFQNHDDWPFGELPHGLDGIIEAYASVLGIEPHAKEVSAYIDVLAQPGWPRGHRPCPCGSGKMIRNCHRQDLNQLREKVPYAMAKRMRDRMANPSR